MPNILVITTTDIILYVLVGLLLVGNILFLILFLNSASKCTELEGQLQLSNREKIENTEHDKEGSQPVGARMEDDVNQRYIIVQNKASEGWSVKEKGTDVILAVAKTKDEAKEIIKSLAKND